MNDSGMPRHRASYILERGVWRATCRVCGWYTSDPQRRQAATLFRTHIQSSRVIDLDALTEASAEVATGPAPVRLARG